jgi:hypothetical protein
MIAPAVSRTQVSPALWNRPLTQACACAVVLYALNCAIAWRLFSVEFTQHMGSNEGTFMAISRFLIERWPHVAWFPFWLNGVPFENTYAPLQQVLVALLAKLVGSSTALAYHRAGAFFYCAAAPLLFWFAWRLSGALGASFFASLLYSLVSPSVLFPPIQVDAGGWLVPRRLQTIVQYGEVAHNIVLALLPLALLAAYLAITRRRLRWRLLAGFLVGAVVLTNTFATTDLAITLVCLAAVQPRGERLKSLVTLGAIGTLAYLWISPLLTPSLALTIRRNSLLMDDIHYTPVVIGAGLSTLCGAVLLWRLTRALASELERFAYLIAYLFFAIVALFYCAGIRLLPQPHRYHLEMELALCLAAPFAVRHIGRFVPHWGKWVLVAVAIVPVLWQVKIHRSYARQLVHQIDVRQTIEFRTAKWIEANLPGLRSMPAGSLGLWFNLFTDNPQLNSGHDPFSPNFMVEIALYAIHALPDAPNSILWLKAFGCQAIAVPGPHSTEIYKPLSYPAKFEGVLPVLWRQDDVAIYSVPQRTKSLAHVIPSEAAVTRKPANGLDTAEVARYVAALDDASLPVADFTWRRDDTAAISAPVKPGQLVSVQVTYDPGWVATANGLPAPVTRDGLGLILIHPQCDGACAIALEFSAGLERELCLAASVVVMFSVFVLCAKRARRRIQQLYGNSS